MQPSICPNCLGSLPDRGAYCPSCAAQARCISCSAVLEANAIACVMCGARIGTLPEGDVAAPPTQPIVANVISFSENRTSRTLNANLTDEAIDSLAAPLAMILGSRVTSRTATPREPADGNFADYSQVAFSDREPSTTEPQMLEVQFKAQVSQPENDIWRIFRQSGDRLRLDESRLKATSQSNAVQRLTYLHLAARSAMGEERVRRGELMDMAKDVRLHDSNWSRVFNETTDLTIEGDEIWLLRAGREKAEQYLREVLDDSIPDHWPISNAGRPRQARVANVVDGASQDAEKTVRKRRSGGQPTASAYVEAWKKLGLPVIGHELIKERKLAEQGIFALWAIRKAVGDSAKEVSTGILVQFLWHAFEIKVNKRSLDKALKESPIAKDKVTNVRGTTFQINPTGMAFAESVVGGQSSAVTVSANGQTIP